MTLLPRLKLHLPEYDIEPVTLQNLSKYEPIFYCNTEYYLTTDSRPAEKQDCIDTVEYGNDFPDGMCYCIGFSQEGEAVAFLALLEGYPEADTLYIGLFLMNEAFKRRAIGTKLITALIDEAFSLQFNFVKLSVQDNNISGSAFWRKLGFDVVSTCDCGGFRNLLMELKRKE